MKAKRVFRTVTATILSLSLMIPAMPQIVRAEGNYNHTYTLDATLLDDHLAGVYEAVAQKGADRTNATLGIPSIAKQNLESMPTKESPAIIQGAVVPFERRVNTSSTIRFDRISSDPVCAPYSKFRYELMEEYDTVGTGTHTKITGFDGTYVIIRVDVSNLIADALDTIDQSADPENPEQFYLHYKQTDNKAMLVAIGQNLVEENGEFSSVTFSDGFGATCGCYDLRDEAASLKDKDGAHTDKPYVDVILMASGANVAGADKGMETAPSADFPVSFYVDQENDYNPEIIWDETTKTIINKETRELVPDITDESGAVIKTAAAQLMEKYYNEDKARTDGGLTDADFTSYNVKGDDLELEVMVDEIGEDLSTEKEYWSMRRAMDCQEYNSHKITLMSEVPVLEGMIVEDTDGSGDREVVLDVNSFDIQIANNKDTDSAGLTVRNATLTIMDDSNTTGAELAVGNNATMLITDGGKLIIDETCQLEVEFDSSSTPVPPEGQEPEPAPEIGNGLLTIENGGEVVNNGIITVEGKEGKAQDPADAQTVIRDYKDAKLTVGNGGTLTNNGCLLVNGGLYNLGTIINNGRYNDVISSGDPDKGYFTYHKGIQMSWKDDITQGHTNMGHLVNGMDEDDVDYPNARIENSGDIVLLPGVLYNTAQIENNGNIFLAAVDEVIVPITATQDAPTVVEERINLGYFEHSFFFNMYGATLTNRGAIRSADFDIVSNGRTGEMTREVSRDLDEMILNNYGTLTNCGNGLIALNRIDNMGHMVHSENALLVGNYKVDGSAYQVATKVVLEDGVDGPDGDLSDSAKVKAAKVYNAARKTAGNTNTWEYAGLASLRVSPASQAVPVAEKGEWAILAESEVKGEDINYLVEIDQDNTWETVDLFEIAANRTVTRETPIMPQERVNLVYRFYTVGTEYKGAQATIRVNDEDAKLGITKPTAMQNLVYNGEEQTLVTCGSSTDGLVQYSLDGGPFSAQRPKAKNAGTYEVNYRVVLSAESQIPLFEGETFTVTIAPRPLYIAVDDQCSKQGAALSQLTYTAFDLIEADLPSLGITLETTAASDSPVGNYPITFTWNGNENPNYEWKDKYGESRISEGIYHISNQTLDLTPPPVVDPSGTSIPQTPGVKSNLGGYANLNQAITLVAKYLKNEAEPAKTTLANVYYSDTIPLDAENYKTAGSVLGVSYAAVGTEKTVYYYIETPTDAMAGSQRVVITKADQKAPGIKTGPDDHENVLEIEVEYQGKGGDVRGIEPRAMEYRRADSTTYTRCISDQIHLTSGVYYFRRLGDAHKNPSPDTEVTIPDPELPFTVTFNAKGGTFADGSTEKTTNVFYGFPIDAPEENPTRADGVNFAAWFSDEQPYDFDTPITSNLELTAEWDIAKHTVTFDSKGGDYVMSEIVEDGAKVARPEEDPQKLGCEFTGWKLYGADYDFNTPVTSDLLLTAGWKPGTYTVKYDANGGAGTMYDQTFTYGSSQELTENAFARAGYTFHCWNTKADGKGINYTDKQSVKDLTDVSTPQITLYAQWYKLLTSNDITVQIATPLDAQGQPTDPVYNGKPQKPNVTVKDGATDITKYCNLTYSNNINAGTARLKISVKSTNAPYAGSREGTFTIAKAIWTLPPEGDGIERQYLYTQDSTDSIDLAQYLPEDRGDTAWTVANDGTVEFSVDPKVENDALTYTMLAAERERNETVRVTATMQNYGDVTFEVILNQVSMALAEQVGKTYVITQDKNMVIGAKATFVAQFADGTINKRVAWESSDPAVATVTQAGKVVAQSAGYTEVRAYSEGNRALGAVVRITVGDPVTGVSLNTKSYSMGTGERLELHANVLPFTAAQQLVWTASNANVRLVVAEDTLSAVVIGEKAGSAKVTATAADGSGKRAVCSVAIGNPVPDFTVNARGNANALKVGGSLQMSVGWQGAKPKNQQVVWKVLTPFGEDASKIATISQKGVLKGLSEGKVRITAISVANPNKSFSREVSIYVPVKKVALNMTSGTVSQSDQANGLQLGAYVTSAVAGQNATGERLGQKPVVRYEIDEKYATSLFVDNNGLVKARKGGTPVKNVPVKATVTAFNGYRKTLTCKVTVSEANPLKGIMISSTALTMGKGTKNTLSVTCNPLNADGDRGVSWESSNEEVATVNNKGEVTAVGTGSAVITATANGTVISRGNPVHPVATCKITVKPSIAQIDFTNTNALTTNGLAAGKSYTLKTALTLSDAGKAANSNLVWESSDPGIATVTQKGVIKAVATKARGQESTVTITATAKEQQADGHTATQHVTFKVYTPATKIVTDKSKLSLGTDENSRYGKVGIVDVLPANVTQANILWTANNENVQLASVNRNDPAKDGDFAVSATTGDGKSLAVKGINPGVTTLTGITTDGSNKKVTCKVTVYGKVTGLKLQTSAGKGGFNDVTIDDITDPHRVKYTGNMKAGSSMTLVPVPDIAGISGATQDAVEKKAYAAYKKYTDTSVSYISSDTDIATVSNAGKITVKKGVSGTVTIYASSADGAYMAQIAITVPAP